MKIENDNTGIANKIVTNLLSKEDWVIEEEEFKKKTKLDISKESLKQNVKDGDTNTYTLNILNVGDNPARIVKVEEELQGNAKIKKDSVRVLNSKGQDVTNDKNIVLKKDITDKKITAIIDNIPKDEKYKVVYDVIYDSSETENNVKIISKVRGLNTEEKQIEDTTNVNGTIKDTSLEISKKSDKKEVKAGDINTYTVTVKNTGSYDARDTVVEDVLYGDAKYIKDTIKVVDKDNNIIDKSKYSIEWIDKKTEKDENRFKIKFPIIEKGKDIIVTYNVQYADLEETQEIKNIIRAKGTNTNLAEPKEKDGVKVISKGVIKETNVDIIKKAEKQEMPAGKKNKYTITIRNTGDYSARNVHIEDIVSSNAKYLKDTISYDKNYDLKVEWDGKSPKVIIPVLKSKEEYILTYYMEYIDSEQDYDVTNTVKIKGDNIKEKEVKEKVLVKGVIKETTLDIIKEVEKKTGKDGDINTYTTSITNTGDYAARNVHIEENIEGNANIVKTSVKVINSKGEDITKTLKKEDLIVKDNNIIVNIPNISSKEKYKIIYDVKYDNSEKDNIVKTITKVKGSNTKEEEKISNYNVKGTVKETNIEVKKTVDKNIIEAGDKNKYKITVKNIGSYDARDITIEDILKGNAKYIKDTIKVSDKNIKVEMQGNIKFNIPLLEKGKGKEIEITYDVEYGNGEKDNIVTNDVEVKGSNVKKNTSTAKVEVLGVKENIVEKEILPKILPKAGKRQRRQIAIYTIIALVLIVPILIIRKEYIQAKRRQDMRKNRRR
jgi:conserved repeat protein